MVLQQIAAYTAAILFAALAAAGLAAGVSGSVNLMPPALGTAAAHAALLGLPLFLLFRWKDWANAHSSACAGFVIGAVPLGAITWPWRGSGFSASLNGVPTVVDGVPTLAGWLTYTLLLMAPGLLGAFSGVVFWLTLSWSGQLRPAQKIGDSEIPAQGAVRPSRAVPLVVIALVLTAAVAAVPQITMDRTCHNMSRDGHTRILPQASIRLDIGMEEWPKLIGVFEKFAVAHNLSFRNSSKSYPGTGEMLYLSVCNEQGANVSVVDQRWASRNYAPFITGGIPLTVYELRAGSGWPRLTQGLSSELESTWPGQVRLQDASGRSMPTRN